MYKTIIVEKQSKIATIYLNRPEILNAVNRQMKEELAFALCEIERDEEVSIVVITGKGEVFCAGVEIMEVTGNTQEDNNGQTRKVEGVSVYKTIANSDKIYIAAINGTISGSGLAMACWCDFRIASDKAEFDIPFVDVGLVPGGGLLYTLPRLIGIAKAKELALLAEVINASKAFELGLVTKVARKEEFAAAVNFFAKQLSEKSYVALALTKNLLNKELSMTPDKLLELEAVAEEVCLNSEYYKQTMAAGVRGTSK